MFLSYMQSVFQTPLIADTKLGGERQMWELDSTAYLRRSRTAAPDPAQVDEVLANVAAQSKLRFHREHRTIKTWVLAEGSSPATTPAIHP
jgi:hypothetical protein